ncbi:hypothetical protein GCM10010357_28180 [Streptomyces luteireticuli]|uniref:Uncharacterized protein n=1 Tax=Streptomyces luteireticuli TaxID=173858 RepID=A0ABN0YQF8_9ACTN
MGAGMGPPGGESGGGVGRHRPGIGTAASQLGGSVGRFGCFGRFRIGGHDGRRHAPGSMDAGSDTGLRNAFTSGPRPSARSDVEAKPGSRHTVKPVRSVGGASHRVPDGS